MTSRIHTHVLFLTFITLPAACGDQSPSSSDAAGATEGVADVTAGSTDASTSTSSSSTTTDEETSTVTETSTTTATTTTASTTTTTTSTTGGDPAAGCDVYADKFVECFDLDPSYYREILAECEMTEVSLGRLYGEACLDAIATFRVCFTGHECREIVEGDPCQIERGAYMAVCASEPGPTCMTYEDKVFECSGEPETGAGTECQTEIDLYAALYGDACGEALEGYYACRAALTCDAFWEGIGCEDKDNLVVQFCSG